MIFRMEIVNESAWVESENGKININNFEINIITPFSDDMSNDDSKNYIRKYRGTPKKNEIKVNPKEIIKKIKEKKKDENYVPFTGFTISQ